MTDYNDGKWHGWNGGECPVHPDTIVDVAHLINGTCAGEAAEQWFWDGEECCIIAFRVVTPYVEPPQPREWWATGLHLHNSRADADAFLATVRADNPSMNFDSYEPVLVREVLK